MNPIDDETHPLIEALTATAISRQAIFDGSASTYEENAEAQRERRENLHALLSTLITPQNSTRATITVYLKRFREAAAEYLQIEEEQSNRWHELADTFDEYLTALQQLHELGVSPPATIIHTHLALHLAHALERVRSTPPSTT